LIFRVVFGVLDPAHRQLVVPFDEAGVIELLHRAPHHRLRAFEHARERRYAAEYRENSRQNALEWPCE
jgi:hypothetical protein